MSSGNESSPSAAGSRGAGSGGGAGGEEGKDGEEGEKTKVIDISARDESTAFASADLDDVATEASLRPLSGEKPGHARVSSTGMGTV